MNTGAIAGTGLPALATACSKPSGGRSDRLDHPGRQAGGTLRGPSETGSARPAKRDSHNLRIGAGGRLLRAVCRRPPALGGASF